MKTNKQLYIDVADKLEIMPAIDATNVTIGVNSGVVTVGGTVQSYAEKRLAERTVQNIDGVTGIANDIEVIKLASIHTDTEIAIMAAKAIEWDSTIPKDKVKVVVENGFLTLIGELNYQHQSQQAEKDVYDVIGVKNVDNQIKIKPLP